MAKDDLANVEGEVMKVSGGGRYIVMLENEEEISAKLCGKMKRFKIRVTVGDKVTVGISPYDTTHGLILLRHK